MRLPAACILYNHITQVVKLCSAPDTAGHQVYMLFSHTYTTLHAAVLHGGWLQQRLLLFESAEAY